MSAYFIAGSGTDIGKTHVTILLLEALRGRGRAVRALKPVASGIPARGAPAFADSDPARLLAAQGLPVSDAALEACAPFRFREPLSPDMAAAAEDRTLAFEAVRDWCRAALAAAAPEETVLVEGVGGIMSPIAEGRTNLDLVLALEAPVVLVVGSYLGAISHALTAVESLQGRGARLAGVVLNESAGSTVDFAATGRALAAFLPGIAITPLRRGAPVLEAAFV